MTTIVLVRHGQTEWNQVERFRGRADVPLNETGLVQAEATARRIASEWQPVAVYSSPLSRAVRTAKAIGQSLSLPVQTHRGLADIDYGRWQGLTPDDARAQWPGEVNAWYHTPHTASIPGGETLDRVRVRAMETVTELAAHHPGETIVLVGHTVVNRAILLGVLGLRSNRFWHLRQDTCALNVFETEGGDFTLVTMNDTCHLRLLAQ
ncbi:MAG: histidine phosphatase family protein [Anaerolineae bacterium]|jgi:broad specificity phosphatase PhoE